MKPSAPLAAAWVKTSQSMFTGFTTRRAMAASAASGAITRNSALHNAQSQAAAHNGALSETINGLDNI
jgi:hypothetical protein